MRLWRVHFSVKTVGGNHGYQGPYFVLATTRGRAKKLVMATEKWETFWDWKLKTLRGEFEAAPYIGEVKLLAREVKQTQMFGEHMPGEVE